MTSKKMQTKMKQVEKLIIFSGEIKKGSQKL
jgi:hypothetical protein